MKFSQSGISINKLVASDAQSVSNVEQLSFPFPWPLEGIIYEATASGALSFTLTDDSKDFIFGYIIGRRVADEAHILNFAIHPDYRGCDYGKLLLNHFENMAIKRGVAVVFLEVRKNNNIAWDLYNKSGYKMIAVRPHYYQNKEDAIIMEKRFSD